MAYNVETGYIGALKILRARKVEGGQPSNPRQANLRRSENISMYNTYMYTELDTSKETFMEAIQKGNYVDNQCWLNTLTDYYKDTLMNNKKKEPMSRGMILKLINKTEQEFTESGASIDDMIPVFIKYRMRVRIRDQLGKIIYSYSPEMFDRNIRAFYAMVKNNHIYTLNNNIKRLEQKQNTDDAFVVKARPDYHISDREKPSICKMFSTIDDIFEMVKATIANRTDKQEKNFLDLVHRENDVNKLFCDFKNIGYECRIVHKAGTISESRADFNNVYLNIRSQCLIDDQINSDITVDRETVYNNMTEAMLTFKKKLFNPNHKSYYSPTDVQVFNNYRTIVPQGELLKGLDKLDAPKQEIDMNKAFTDAFNTITRIGVFNQFDNWKAYNSKCKIKDVNIYVVKAELTHRNLFFNNDTNIVYGMFLKHFMPLVASGELSITHYKQPHFIHKVDNKMLLEELWGKRISENIEEDKAIKKNNSQLDFWLVGKK